jgi:hypothetical protein
MGRFEVPPPTVTVVNGDDAVRCLVVAWDDDGVQCQPERASLKAPAFFQAQVAVEVVWSTETSLRTVAGVITDRPEGGVVDIRFEADVSSVQRRDRVRARCVFRAELAIALGRGARRLEAETIDLSATGVGLRASTATAAGTRVLVAVFPTVDAPLPLIAGRIAAVDSSAERVGVAFTSALPGDLDKVASVVARLLSNRAAH